MTLEKNNDEIEKKETINHDAIFKELLKTFFIEFIEAFVPDVDKYLDKDSIEFLDKEAFTSPFDGSKYACDLLVKAKFKFEDVYFLIHIDNQNDSRAVFPSRMFWYFALFHQKHKLPVYPIAVLSFDSPKKEHEGVYTVNFPDREVLKFNYRVVQLNRFNWKDYLKTDNPLAAAMMVKMGIAAEDRVRVKVECTKIILGLKLNPNKSQLLLNFVETYSKLTQEQEKEFETELQHLNLSLKEEFMEVANRWVLKGIEQGIEQGELKGKKEGEQKVILKQLHKRFGSVPAEVEESVKKLELDGLESLAEAIFDFNSVDDLLAWFKR
ncbi:MAG: DUF4351 domain-containing protein [Blastocatellia bacterium]|nr:DUF4351 domain-containing protein [Blastocatellia bacterium]